MVRKVTKQSSFTETIDTVSANNSTTYTFKVQSGQAWRINSIEVFGKPDLTVDITYDDEGANRVTLPTLYIYDFPFEFKQTATGNPLIMTETHSMYVKVTNPYSYDVDVRVRLRYVKVYTEGR